MSGDIQQGSGSISSPDSGQDHHKFNQASRSDQRERQPKSVRFVTDDPESPQHPDLSGGPASANNVDASRRSGCVPDLEAINCTISSMAAENIQENQDSDAEPDACVTNAHGGNPTSSVSEDYVPWFGLDADHYELPKYRGIIPNIHRFSRKLYLVFVVMVVSTSIIRLTTTTYFDHIFIDFIRWMMNLTVGLVLDCLFSVMFGELCSFVLTSKLSFNSGCSLLSIPVIVLIIIFVYPLNPLGAYRMFPVWHTGFLPQPFHGCEARVSPTQSSLFTQHTYARQFARIWDANATDFSDFDMQAFDAIRHDQTLCNQGFIGNADVYGLGSRISLYLQWLTALLVNNFVPRSRHEFRKIYVAYSLGLCIATLVFTFSTACTFAIEIEILYWAYWGGHLCVFVTSPSYTRLGSKVKWIRLDWMTGINYLLHVLMFYHSTFFWHYGYDQFFSRMPCGTYHFFFAALLDPSKSFWHCRDVLTVIIFPARVALMLIIPIVILVLISEIKSSIYESPVFQNLCIYLRGSGRPNSETVLAIDAAQASLSSRLRHRFRASSFLWVRPYRGLRGWVHLPHNSREGIRLITPLDIKERMRYRIFCAMSGLASCVVCIAAIETILQYNKIVGVNSIASTGQYLAFILGVSTFITACWQALKQETERRRHLSRRALLNNDAAEIELETLPHTVSGAIRHAFGQADIPFVTNGGAFEASSGTTAEESEGGPSGQASTHCNDPENIPYLMSGAL